MSIFIKPTLKNDPEGRQFVSRTGRQAGVGMFAPVVIDNGTGTITNERGIGIFNPRVHYRFNLARNTALKDTPNKKRRATMEPVRLNRPGSASTQGSIDSLSSQDSGGDLVRGPMRSQSLQLF